MRCALGLAVLLGAACGGSGGNTDGPDAGQDGGMPGPLVAYVGGYGSEIGVYAVDPETLAFTPLTAASSGGGPSFLAVDPQRRWLIAVDEQDDTIESFAIGDDGTLTSLGATGSGGSGPAHVGLDATGTWALVANYGSGTVSSAAVASDGALSGLSESVPPGANAHQVVATADGIVYVPCLGDDLIAVYDFDASSGALTVGTPADADPGAGPRHLALRPDGAVAWVINELASTITTYTVQSDGSLTQGATVSTLPGGFGGQNTGAEIAVHPSGQWVLASNRGHDSIAVFAAAQDGSLTLHDTTPSGGATPRHFSFLPGSDAIVVANQDGGTIHGFRFDADTGDLTAVGELTSAFLPTYVGVIEL
jgi:6-phosphogluconolactonase